MSVSKSFILAGDAIFTIEIPAGMSPEAKPHYTFRIQHVAASDRWPESFFVKLLTGPDNETSYSYVGKLNSTTGLVSTTAKSRFSYDSFPVRLLNRVLARVWADDHAAYEAHGVRTHHEGRCGRCARRLTVPESIESGIGPECARIMSCERVA